MSRPGPRPSVGDVLTSRQVPTAPFATLGVLVAVVLLLPFPGSLSVVVSRWAVASSAGLPMIDLVSLGALGLLAAGVVVTAVRAWRRHPGRLPAVLGAAAGVVLAYGTSEAAKVLLVQGRPCARWDGVPHCPPAGDWSLPSNHATVAFAAVVVIAVAARSTWATWAAVVVALLAAAGRVLEGVHYPHDVALGAVVGLSVAAGAAWCGVVLRRRAEGHAVPA